MSKQWVVFVGTVFGAKSIHGPFESRGQAETWVWEQMITQPYTIEPLEPIKMLQPSKQPNCTITIVA